MCMFLNLTLVYTNILHSIPNWNKFFLFPRGHYRNLIKTKISKQKITK